MSSERRGLNLVLRWRSLRVLSLAALLVGMLVQPSYSQESELEKAKRLLDQVSELYQQGCYAEAVPIAEEVLAINEKALGPEHPKVATILNNLALLYHSLGDYAKAEPLYKRALAINENSLGPEHPIVAINLNNLADFYRSVGDYAKAEPLCKRALAINENSLGPEHPKVAWSLNGLANLYHSIGDHAKAEPLYERALAINENSLGPEHPKVATILNNLGDFYRSLGDYAKAESLHKKALWIFENSLGPQHPSVAEILNSLANLYCSLGDYAKAEPLNKRALAINENSLGPQHPNVATNLNNLAEFYRSLGDYAKAEPLYRRALTIHEKALGPEHPKVATILNNLALLYHSIGDHAKAEPLYERALATNENSLGPEHPSVATILTNLANLYRSLGEYAKAEPLYERALAINENSLGPEHPSMATILNSLALLCAYRKNFAQAYDLASKAQAIDSTLIDQVMGFTSEEEKIKFLSTKRWSLYGYLSVIVQYLRQDPSVRIDALNVWLKRKGVILEAQKRFQEALVYSHDSQAMKTFQELSKVRAQMSKLAFSGTANEGSGGYENKITYLQTQKETLEARLSQLSHAFALKQKIAKADCEKVAGALPANTALIEFARVEMLNSKATGKGPEWKPAHYLAFVLHAGKGPEVGLLDLGDAEKIDKAVVEFKKEISNTKDIKCAKAIQPSRKIYGMVFEPLRNELGDVKEIFISPDGNLNLIPFEVLQGPDGRYLIEDYTFNYLAAGRDVLGFGQIKGKGNKALLMGDPDFDMDHEEKKPTLRKMALIDRGLEKITRRSADMKGFHFTRLPGAKEEVKAIQKILGNSIKSETYLGSKAFEEVLKQKSAPRILHLATHGFFLNDQELDSLPADPTGRGFYSITMPVKEKGRKARIENPMLRSGFALAGANKSLQDMDEQVDDGIVTSEEILGLQLRGTDMVVLSACDTGLGEVKTGEGVFGLRRAFAQAGAKSLIMSLWAVPDKETRELMVQFYKNIMSGKMSRCQALRQAALKEMKIVKERYGHAHPFCWGGFVMVGDPG